MSKSKYTEDFKKEVGEATFEEGMSLAKVGEKYNVHPTLVRNWRIKYCSDRLSADETKEIDEKFEDEFEEFDDKNISPNNISGDNTFLFKLSFITNQKLKESNVYELIRDAIYAISSNATEGKFSIIEGEQAEIIGYFPKAGKGNHTSQFIPKIEELESKISKTTIQTIIDRGEHNEFHLICKTTGDFLEHGDFNFKKVDNSFTETVNSLIRGERDSTVIYGPLEDKIISVMYSDGEISEGYFLDIEEDLDNDDVDEGHLLTKENLKGHWWGKKEIGYMCKNFWKDKIAEEGQDLDDF